MLGSFSWEYKYSYTLTKDRILRGATQNDILNTFEGFTVNGFTDYDMKTSACFGANVVNQKTSNVKKPIPQDSRPQNPLRKFTPIGTFMSIQPWGFWIENQVADIFMHEICHPHPPR